jgi:hypothetical protein
MTKTRSGRSGPARRVRVGSDAGSLEPGYMPDELLVRVFGQRFVRLMSYAFCQRFCQRFWQRFVGLHVCTHFINP